MSTQLPPPPAPSDDWAWFLDIDGTLIEIAPTPSAISIPLQLPGLLAQVAERWGGALALISGRTLDNIRQLVAPFDPPAAGLHGLERRAADGSIQRAHAPAGLDAVRAGLAEAAQWPGILVEDKGLALALHYRQNPALEGQCRALAEQVAAAHPEFSVQAGRMVFELKPKAWDKGGSVRAFMAEPPFAGRRPVFIGDDLTDEHGFQAANELGGLSILVGETRDTAARHWLPDIDACRGMLAKAVGKVWAPPTAEGGD